MTRPLFAVVPRGTAPLSRLDMIKARDAESAADARIEAVELERDTLAILARHEAMAELQAAPVGVREASRSLARDLKSRMANYAWAMSRAK